VRTTLTLDPDVVALLEKENRRANEPMKQTVNRALRSGLILAIKPPAPKRFVVVPFDTGLTSEQWMQWEAKGMNIEDILEEAEANSVR